MKYKIKIRDNSFNHCYYSSNPTIPVNFSDKIEWDWNLSNIKRDELIFFTHSHIQEGVNYQSKNKICWLIEPYDLVPHNYESIKRSHQHFKYVLTYEKSLLDLGENFLFIPSGGTWIKPEDRKMWNKNKLVSIISSGKRMLSGHKLRHETINKYKNKMDVMGNGYKPFPLKVDGLKDYMFSLVIENCKRDYYFTEKLIDCLLTGTVPIYWGCPSIGDFFNEKGFIIVDNINDINDALNKITPEMYEEMKPYIEENLETAKKYNLAENFIYSDYIKTKKITP